MTSLNKGNVLPLSTKKAIYYFQYQNCLNHLLWPSPFSITVQFVFVQIIRTVSWHLAQKFPRTKVGLLGNLLIFLPDYNINDVGWCPTSQIFPSAFSYLLTYPRPTQLSCFSTLTLTLLHAVKEKYTLTKTNECEYHVHLWSWNLLLLSSCRVSSNSAPHSFKPLHINLLDPSSFHLYLQARTPQCSTLQHQMYLRCQPSWHLSS